MFYAFLVGLLCVCYWIQNGSTLEDVQMPTVMAKEIDIWIILPTLLNKELDQKYTRHNYTRTQANGPLQSTSSGRSVAPQQWFQFQGENVNIEDTTVNTGAVKGAKIKNELASRVEILRSEKINLCISEIKSGNSISAAQEFTILADNDLLSEIIKNSFEVTVPSMNNVLDFIDNLPYLEQRAISFLVLFDIIREISDSPHNMLELYLSKLNVLTVDPNYKTIPDQLQTRCNYIESVLKLILAYMSYFRTHGMNALTL